MMKSAIHKEFDYKGAAKVLEIGVKVYSENYEKFKNIAEDYNIDLFICDILINEACLDVAHTLKKPVVGFSSYFQSNYKFLFIILFYLKNFFLKKTYSITFHLFSFI